jgi:hypothetical protein
MSDTSLVSLGFKIATSPVWILWRGYKGLWWVFGESSPAASRTTRSTRDEGSMPDPAAAAPAISDADPSHSPAIPAMPVPIGLLRGGFAGTALASVGFLLIGQAMSAASVIEPERAMFAWLWATLAASVGSIFAVRSIARRRHARSHKGLRGTIRRTVANAVDVCSKAGAKAIDGTKRCAKVGAAGAAIGSNLGARGLCWGAEKAKSLDQRYHVKDRAARCAGSAWSAVKRAADSIGTPVKPDPSRPAHLRPDGQPA